MLMRTRISKVVMCVATLLLLLMSAIPHHHHCTEADTFRHIDYICFSDDGAIERDACGDCCSDHEANHDMEHSHEGGHVHLHSIVTIAERIVDVPAYLTAFELITPELLLPDSPLFEVEHVSQVPVDIKLLSTCLPRVQGKRGPPSSAVC